MNDWLYRDRLAIWLATVCVLLTIVIAAMTGQMILLGAGMVTIMVAIQCWVRPPLSVTIALLLCVSFAVLQGLNTGEGLPVTITASDLALVLIVLGGWSGQRQRYWGRVGIPKAAWLCILPLLVVVGVSGLTSVLTGSVAPTTVAVSVRVFMWYAAVPFMVSAMGRAETIRLARLAILTIGAALSALLIATDFSPGLASLVGPAIGSSSRTVPGLSTQISRLYIPGMILVPTALGLALGDAILTRRSRLSWRSVLLAALYAAGIVATFGRGMWISTALAVLAVFMLRSSTRSAARLAVLIILAFSLMVGGTAILGQVQAPSAGFTSLISQRLTSVSFNSEEQDANTAIRFLEMRETVAQVTGHEILGLGVATAVGHDYGAIGSSTGRVVGVHNAYYFIYGKLGMAGLAALLCFVITTIGCGISVLRSYGSRSNLAFGFLVGFLQGLISSWTQDTLVTLSGAVAMIACASALIAMKYSSCLSYELSSHD